MGYTHYWNTKENAEDQAGFLKALPIVAQIVNRYEKILRFESDSKRLPVVTNKQIRFNGIYEDGHETFCFQLGANDFCKTARKPYDLPVCEILLVLKYFIPSMDLRSDGFSAVNEKELDGVWDRALAYVEGLYGLEFKKFYSKRPAGNRGDFYTDLVALDPIKLCPLCEVLTKIAGVDTNNEVKERKQTGNWRIASNSEPGLYHWVTAYDNGDIHCSCKGFHYRNTCRHLKEAGF